ncbi:hypothetical protein QE152_g8261 [Popillia japonica]|uniref:Uncharacterized protein n=1 Tax=Popillia japonica TaxID=7064 RepID=A0AAW1MD40_POPJA
MILLDIDFSAIIPRCPCTLPHAMTRRFGEISSSIFHCSSVELLSNTTCDRSSRYLSAVVLSVLVRATMCPPLSC